MNRFKNLLNGQFKDNSKAEIIYSVSIKDDFDNLDIDDYVDLYC